MNNSPLPQNKVVKLVLFGSLIGLSLFGVTVVGVTVFAFHLTINNNYPGSTPAPIIIVTPTPAITITSTVPVYSPTQAATPQQIDVPAGVSKSVLAADCVDTFDFANIHAKYIVVFDHGPSKRAKITENGTVVGTATIYRNSGCYSS
jgi:hypothetical protein